MDPAKIFVMNHRQMSIDKLVYWLRDSATLQEAHPFHKVDWSTWAPGALKFRQHADELLDAAKAVETKEPGTVKKRDQAHEEALWSIDLNASYIAVRARAAKDDSVLSNCGYVLKEKNKRSYTHASLRSQPSVVKLKNSGIGEVTVIFPKDPAAGAYQMQICKGHPTGDESWGEQGMYKNCRPVVTGLDRANWYYFRVRSIGDNETGPWSAPVGIIVV